VDVETWCRALIEAETLEGKLSPSPRPSVWSGERRPPPEAPGRPPSLRSLERPPKTPKPGALVHADKRAQLLHTFFHHELQAAELMAWAVLAFPDTPLSFRRGLLRIADDELRHAREYAAHLDALGYPVGAFGVRDWFWERVPSCPTPLAFVSLFGLGFEGANLDHTARFAKAFRAAGDEAGAALQERIGAEEIPHVRFARRWYERFVGQPVAFDAWRGLLPAPLTPLVLRGKPLCRPARREAGLDDAFLDALEGYGSP
jgi:uncharacterized ferritin-like protein (DUF455 family)